MTLETPYAPPIIATAGDTLSWRKSFPDYPASAWTLTYILINAAAKYTVTATADGDEHVVSAAAATTAAWLPGVYTLVGAVSDGTDRHTVSSSAITISPDLAAQASGYDARSTARKAMDDLRAALAQWIATQGHITTYTIDGVSQTFASAADLRARITWLEKEVAREDAAAKMASGLGTSRRVLVRF